MTARKDETIGVQMLTHLRNLELYVEDRPAIQILASVFLLGIAALTSLLSAYQVLGPNLGLPQIIIVLLLILAAVLVIDFKHTRLLSNRMKEINKRDQHIRSLTEAMAFQTQRIEVPCVNESIQWTYDILDDGTGRCIKETVVSPIDNPLYLFTLPIGATGQAMDADDSSALKMVVTGVDDDHKRTFPLLHYLVEDSPRSKRFCIVLHSPIQVGESAKVHVEYQWPGLWKGLLERCEDDGFIQAEHPIREMEVVIKAPPGYEITAFASNPNMRDYDVQLGNDSRSVLTWRAQDIAKGTRISYKIFARKRL